MLNAQRKASSDVKYQLGQSYERVGDFESAVKFYEDAFLKDSSNNVIFDALRRVYLQLKRYNEAISLLNYWIKKNPGDVGTLTQLGSVYELNSEEPKAFEVWERAISLYPNQEITYRLVAGAAIQSRLFERAIDYYRRGRVACNNPMLFCSDIAYLYSIVLNYREATIEYLNLLRQSPSQLGYVESRIAMYTERADGLKVTTDVIEQTVKSESDNINFQQLLAWLYMEGNKFDEAYNVYKNLDVKIKAGGREVFNFAERAFQEKSFSSALKAYQEVITSYPKFEQMALAKFGYARTLEEANQQKDTLKLFGFRNPFSEHLSSVSRDGLLTAIEAYKKVIDEFPNTEIAARSLFRISVIDAEKFSDFKGAQYSLELLLKNYQRFPAVVAEGKLLLGDISLSMGNIASAEAQFKSLSEQVNVAQAIKEKAKFHLAEIDYYSYKFQDALGKLDTLTINPTSDVANDAMSLKIFIKENLSEDALKDFASADLLNKQHKTSEALTGFEAVVKKYPQSALVDEAMMNMGDIQIFTDRYQDAIATYDAILTEYPESIFSDQVMMKIGLAYQYGLLDKVKATDTYQKLLEIYPGSIFANDARKRIRELRGDSI